MHVNNPAGNHNRFKATQIDCPSGTKPLGGGAQVTVAAPSSDHGVLLSASTLRGNGWFASAEANAGVTFSWGLMTTVICAKVG